MLTAEQVEQRVGVLVAILGWDWSDGLQQLEEEPDEVLLEYVGYLLGPNPDGSSIFDVVDPDADPKRWRYDFLSRQGVYRANKVLWSRSR